MRLPILVALLCCSLVLQAQQLLDSLLRVLPGQTGIERIRTLGEVEWEVSFSDPQKALPYGREALALADALGDSAAVAIAANDMAVSAHRAAAYTLAIALNERALRIRRAAGDSSGMAASHAKLSTAYTELHRMDSALVHGFAAADLLEALKDNTRSAQVRGNLSRIYQLQNNLAMAEKAAQRAVDLLVESGNDYALAAAWGQLGSVRIDLHRYDAAYDDSFRAKELFERIGALNDAAIAANQLGMICRSTDRKEEGRRFYEEAIDMAERSNDPAALATYSHNMGNALLDMGRTKETLRYYERSLRISRANGYIGTRLEVLEDYSVVLEQEGRFADALKAEREWRHLRDSMNAAERLGALAEMQVKYETERTEKELFVEKARNEEQELQLSRQRLRIVALGGGLLLLALIAGLVVSIQRARHRQQLNKEVIAERELGLRAMVENTDTERTRIASELHDGVGQLLTGLKYRVEAAATDRPELRDLLSLADDASREVRGIAHRMMPRALEDLGLVPAIADMLSKSLALPNMHHSFEHFGLEQRLPQRVETGVYRIAQELVNNLIKHAQARNVQVQLLRNKGHLVLMVEDDGIGIDPARVGKGLGMRNLQDRARVLHGTLDIEPGPERGTICTLRVPLTNGNLVQ